MTIIHEIVSYVSEVGAHTKMVRFDTMKCARRGCPNRRNEGTFIGLLCAPCHQLCLEGRRAMFKKLREKKYD